MSKFLKLTNFILNTSDIHKIAIQPNAYLICVVSKKRDGFSWGIGGFGLGNISTDCWDIEVCKTKYPTDYKIVSDWIDTL